jgi:hypothetical protein
LVMYAWNFSQTFAQAWLGEQSFRCIDLTHVRRISMQNRLAQVSVSVQPPVYAREQIIPIAAAAAAAAPSPPPLEQICVSINISLHWRRCNRERERLKARYRFIPHIITNDVYLRICGKRDREKCRNIFIYRCMPTSLLVLEDPFPPNKDKVEWDRERERGSTHTSNNLDQNIHVWWWWEGESSLT